MAIATQSKNYCRSVPIGFKLSVMITNFALLGAVPAARKFVLYGFGSVVLLVFGIIDISFGMIYIRTLFLGAKVTIIELLALRL